LLKFKFKLKVSFKNFCRCLTEIKSNWLVISEVGNAVCGVD